MKRWPALLLVLIATLGNAQSDLTTDLKKITVRKLAQLLRDHYVFKDKGDDAAAELERRWHSGDYDSVKNMKSFARLLTDAAQSVTHDKHLRVRLNDDTQRFARSGPSNAGFRESKILEGNIGYLDIRGFLPKAVAAKAADGHMKKFTGVKALVIDMRKNGGGSPDMVQYLCSYFFKDRIHLNSLYFRATAQTTEYWTIDVAGTKMPDVPLYVLTSNFTFSGGEEFCYNMQTRKRATLVGETTGGGANPGDVFQVNEKFSAFIPTGTAINPVTHKNWEGVGVVPDVMVAEGAALEKALELIRSKP